MKLVFVLLFLALISSSAYGLYPVYRHRNASEYFGNSISKRIENADDVLITEAPFMALVYADKSFDNHPHTTAVIISDRYLLSSATFFFVHFGKSMKAYMGHSDLTSFHGKIPYTVDDVEIHPRFDELRFIQYNIALIKLKEFIIFNELQKPIALLSPNDILSETGIVQVNMYGFGYTQRDGETSIILKNKTVAMHTALLGDANPISLGNVKTCAGDAGAALVLNKKLVAININSNGCGENSFTDFYVTGVQAYYDWIREKVGDEDLSHAEYHSYGVENIVENEYTIELLP